MSDIFRALPKPIQELLISAYGYRQARVRYGTALPEPHAAVMAGADAERSWVAAQQHERFAALIRHAAEFVPYYRTLFAQLGLTPFDITLENHASVLPVLTKETLRARNAEFFSEAFVRGGLKLFTSGTSGSPLEVLCDPQARAVNYAYFRRILTRAGSDVRARSATFAGRLFVRDVERDCFWRQDRYNRTLYLSSYHLSDETMPSYLRALEDWAPEYVDSYPSAISRLAEFVLRTGTRHGVRLKFVLTSSETLTEFARHNIEQAFGCTVIDHYGCTEMAVWATARQATGYEVEPLYALCEYRPTERPEEFDLITTGLLNFAMPLIRYEIGDCVLAPGPERPGDGVPQTFERVLGRQEDVVMTPEGRVIGRLDPAFKGVEGIVRAQIVQVALDVLEVLVIPVVGADMGNVEEVLRQNLRARTSSLMTVKVRAVDDIPLTKSGKFQAVVSRLPSRHPSSRA